MEIPTLAVGAILAALIAGLASVSGLIIAKEQKVSEFRQQWIEGLRADVAELLAHIQTVQLLLIPYRAELEKGLQLPEQGITAIRESYCASERLYRQVQLRLNPDEHKSLLDLLDQIAAGLKGHSSTENLEDELTKLTKSTLKAEWQRVKRGEPSFVLTKRIAAVLLLVAFLVLFLTILSTTQRPLANPANGPATSAQTKNLPSGAVPAKSPHPPLGRTK